MATNGSVVSFHIFIKYSIEKNHRLLVRTGAAWRRQLVLRKYRCHKGNPRAGSCARVFQTAATHVGRSDRVSTCLYPSPSPAGQSGVHLALLPGPDMARNSLSRELFNLSSWEIRECHHPQRGPTVDGQDPSGHFWAQRAARGNLWVPRKRTYPRSIDRT